MPVSPIDPTTGAPSGNIDWAKLLGNKRAQGPVQKDGKVVSVDPAYDPAAMGSFLEMMRNGSVRDIQPMEMPSVSYGSRAEFDADQKTNAAAMAKKYPNAGKNPGVIAPQNDPIGGGYTAKYNPGEKGMDYTGGPKMTATSGGYSPESDGGLQSALSTAAMGVDSPQAPPDVFRAVKRRRIMNQLDDPAIAALAAQYGIIPGDEMLRGIRGY